MHCHQYVPLPTNDHIFIVLCIDESRETTLFIPRGGLREEGTGESDGDLGWWDSTRALCRTQNLDECIQC